MRIKGKFFFLRGPVRYPSYRLPRAARWLSLPAFIPLAACGRYLPISIFPTPDSALHGTVETSAPALPPSPTPEPTRSPLPSPAATVQMQANCRYGPGQAYLYSHGLYAGDRAEVHSRNDSGSWLWVKP